MLSPSPAPFHVLVSPAVSSLTFWMRQEPEVAFEPAGPLEARVNLTSDLVGLAAVGGIVGDRNGQHLPIRRCGPGLIGHRLAGFFGGDVNRIRVHNLHRDRVICLASDRLVLAVGLYVDFWGRNFRSRTSHC